MFDLKLAYLLAGSLIVIGFFSITQAQHATCTSPETCSFLYSTEYLHDVYYSGLRRVSKNAKTAQCNMQIEYEYMKYFRSVSEESPFLFENVLYHGQCNKTDFPPLQPVVKEALVSKLGIEEASYKVPPLRKQPLDPEKTSILYVMLVHNHPEFALRIIDAIDEPMHHFIVHVDLAAPDVFEYLQQQVSTRRNIYMLDAGRERISWGGFSIVNATLNCFRFAAELGLNYDYTLDISGTTYPLKSNRHIRKTIADNTNSLFMETYYIPSRPEPHMWNQFVECDGALHRVGRIPVLKGINMYIGSQWFAAPKYFIDWLLSSALPRDYFHYAQYIIIADENYFSTMYFNSPYCNQEVRKSLVFLLFDKWEHERNETAARPRDPKKCLGVGDESCGRSPTTLTVEYKHLISSSRSLFARKFDPNVPESLELLDFIDKMRGTGFCNSSNYHDYEACYPEEIQRWDNNKDGLGKRTMIKAGNLHLVQPEGKLEQPQKLREQDNTGKPLSVTNIDPQHEQPHHHQDYLNSPKTLSNITKNEPESKGAPDQNSAMCLMYMGAHDPSRPVISLQPCDPSNAHQWFEIGRCSGDYEIVIEDKQCPSFRYSNSSHRHGDYNSSSSFSSDSAIHGTSNLPPINLADIYCNIYIGSSDSDMCLDISGESASYDNMLIGYDCTGRWNQLFRLGENCSISAVQPEVVGRVRGYENQVVTLCLDSSNPGGVLTTAECTHLKNAEPRSADQITLNASTNTSTYINDTIQLIGDGDHLQHSSKTSANFTWGQQFEFMPADGSSYSGYLF